MQHVKTGKLRALGVTTAQRLAIHRNTVIYRLDKITRLTGRDVRDPVVATALYLGCLLAA